MLVCDPGQSSLQHFNSTPTSFKGSPQYEHICDKCGFPKNSLEKYVNMFEEKNIKYENLQIRRCQNGNGK